MKVGADGVVLVPTHPIHTRMTLWWDQHMSCGLSGVCLHMQIFAKPSYENWGWESLFSSSLSPHVSRACTQGGMSLCLLEELVSTGWHEAWDLPARRGQGGRERTDIPGHDWAGNGHTKVPVGKVSATGPMTNISKRVCWGFLCVLKKYQKICLFLFLVMLRARVLG